MMKKTWWLLGICGIFGARAMGALTYLDVFEEEGREVQRRLPLPGIGEVSTAGVGKAGGRPEIKVKVQAPTGRARIVEVVYNDGTAEMALNEGKGGEWFQEAPKLSLPLHGYVGVLTDGGGLTVKPLCALKESYLAARTKMDGCFAKLGKAKQAAEDLGLELDGQVLLDPAIAAGPSAVAVQLKLPATDRRQGMVSLFLQGAAGKNGKDFTAWPSAHYRFAQDDCLLAPAAPADLGRALKPDTLTLRCTIQGDILSMRLSARFFGKAGVPKDFMAVLMNHDGGFADNDEFWVKDLVGPVRVMGW